jgi:hypothetical protein
VFVDEVGAKLRVRQLSDWYNISSKKQIFVQKILSLQTFFLLVSDFRAAGGWSMLHVYKESLCKMLRTSKCRQILQEDNSFYGRTVYPNFEWKEWLFAWTPKGFWDDKK